MKAARFGKWVSPWHWSNRIVLGVLLFSLAFTAWGGDSTNEPAKVTVSGFGFLENRELVQLLRNFQVNGEMPGTLERAFVEDATLVLLSRATDDGYLRATLQEKFKMADGTKRQFGWTNALDVMLPPDFAATQGRFKLKSGVRFYYQKVSFDGLHAISPKEAESYFVSDDLLLRLRHSRVFSPANLKSSLAALRETYARRGYEDAVVTTNRVKMNYQTGAVQVDVLVREGLRTVVRSVDVKIHPSPGSQPEAGYTLRPDVPFSQLWQQSFAQKLQTAEYVKGYPDATVEFSTLARQTNVSVVGVKLLARVMPGPLEHMGEIIFRGNQQTKVSVLKSRVDLQRGELLDRVEAEKSRERLARLGVFESVQLKFEPAGPATRNVVYDLEETQPITLSVLGGFGSYELLRGGLEFQDRNFLGRAHDLRMRGLQSFKSTSGDLLYTVPEVFGENVNLFLQGTGLRRDEESFTREEYGGSLGLQRKLVTLATDLTLRYDYEFLNALDLSSTNAALVGVDEAKAAAFIIELTRDRRDNPLLPRRGLKLSAKLEFATESLGGNVDYQRFVFGASYHLDLGGGRLLHLGLEHGLSFTAGGNAAELPFNKRFFPGGENSVRGYAEGKASPLDENGNQLGAETYTQGNAEFEQLLTKSWSVVAFFDAVGFAQNRKDYPWTEGLYSIGGGLNWRTVIGPVRLEYGYNLRRRQFDPVGTLQFSIGYPF